MADPPSRALHTFCRALLPPEHGGPDPAELTQVLERYLEALPPAVRAATTAGFLATVAGASLLAGRPLGSLDADRGGAALERLAALRPEAAAAVDGLKAMVLLANGAERHAEALLRRGRAEPPTRPDPVLDLTRSPDWPSVVTCDVVVIGSGAGGAMVARTLARAGASVVVLEEGRRWPVDELRATHPLDRFAGLYRDGGATVALGRPPVMLPIGRAVGGTTVVNSGTCYRTPDAVARRWRDGHGVELADPEALAPRLDDVEVTLGVAPVPLSVMGRNGQMLLAGADALGWRSGALQRNAPGCGGSCQCAIGCPRNAKAGVHLNALPKACEAGARIVSDARVERVLHESGRAVGVRARRPDGTTFEVRATRVVVAAGAAETPALLWRSGLGAHPELGRNLAVHPALGAAGVFEQPVLGWQGVLQSAAVEQWHESHGILLEATSTPQGMGSMVLPGYGPPLLRWIERSDHLATVGAMIGDESSGRVVSRAGQTLLRYDLSTRDGRRLVVALSAMGRVLLAAGATEVLLGVPGQEPVRSVAELDDALTGVDPRSLHLAAFHPTGTARMGADAQRAPVGADGRLRGVDGVWVADASVLPTCPEVNPQVTIMALALAIAEHVVARG